jgi:phosphatidylcholine synthase
MKQRAYLVHLLTASGLIPMMLSVDAIWQSDARRALIWLGVAMIIDGLDGPLARRFEVAKYTPHIDGAILDHVIDFTGYCFLPALMIYHFDLVPAYFSIIAPSFLLMTSLYTFANRDAKTKENDFRGFPALWNIVVFYMIVFESGQGLNLSAIAFFGAMTFAPTRFIHPVRVVALRHLTIALLAIWTFMVFAYLGLGRAALPPLMDWVFMALSVYFLALSGWRSWALRGGDEK